MIIPIKSARILFGDEENLADPDGVGIGEFVDLDDSVDRDLILPGDGGEALPGCDYVLVSLSIGVAPPG